jgi:hypothetical protein
MTFSGLLCTIFTVDTLKLGYSLLLYKNAVPRDYMWDQVMTHPSLGRLLWASNSTLPHHMGGSGAAACPEKVTYSEASPVSPDPHGKVSDPCIYVPGLQVWSRTSTVGSQGSRTEHTRALIKTQAGVRCRHVSRPDLVGSGPYHMHSCSPPRRRPDAATWPTAHGVSQRAELGMKPLGYACLCIHYG